MYATRHTVPTLLGQYNQLASQIGASMISDQDTTINAKRAVQANVWPAADEAIKLQYFGIGIRGASSAVSSLGADDIPVMVPYLPSEANMDLFHPIPVRMALQGTLSVEDRANYRMRTTQTIDGVGTFDVFWLKKVEINDVQEIKFETVDTDESRAIYELDPANINPSIPDGTETPENIVVSTVLGCSIEGWELDEVITHILGGQRELACVSEYGLYSGADHDFGDEIEAVGVQLAMHRCLRGHDFSSPNAKITENFILENGNSLIARSFE